MNQKKIILEIKDLCGGIEGKDILNGVNLKVYEGEIHALMGRNGSGKSTLSKMIAGHPEYTITSGQILFRNKDLTQLDPEERSNKGVFLGFQYPIEIPGVKNIDFLRVAVNQRRKLIKKDAIKTNKKLIHAR